jgi:hypothetical protein
MQAHCLVQAKMWPEAEALHRHLLERCEAADDRVGAGEALVGLGDCAAAAGDVDGARARYEEGLERHAAGHSDVGVAMCRQRLGGVHEFDPDGRAALLEAMEAFEAMGESHHRGQCFMKGGERASEAGLVDEAREWYRWAEVAWADIGEHGYAERAATRRQELG